jgi:hypothetical protein
MYLCPEERKKKLTPIIRIIAHDFASLA